MIRGYKSRRDHYRFMLEDREDNYVPLTLGDSKIVMWLWRHPISAWFISYRTARWMARHLP